MGLSMAGLGKMLVIFGGLVVLLGLILVLLQRANLPIGRLPGDIVYRGKNTTFYFPVTTCIILSVVLSLVFYLVGKFNR
jgi:hypothetical protein